MKSGIPGGLTAKKNPGPRKQLMSGGNDSKFSGLTATDKAFIKNVQRVMTMNRTQCPHIEETTHLGIAHLGDGGTLAHRSATDMRLRVKTDQSRKTFGRTLTRGQGLPAIEQDDQRQDDLGTDPWQGQQTVTFALQVGVLAQLGGNRFLHLTQRLLQRLKHLG